MDKLLLTVEEAAEVLSLGRTVIYGLMAQGVLESVVVGRSRRVPVEALNLFVQGLPRDKGPGDTHRSEWGPGDRALRPRG